MYPHTFLIPVCPITHVHTLVLVLVQSSTIPLLMQRPTGNRKTHPSEIENRREKKGIQMNLIISANTGTSKIEYRTRVQYGRLLASLSVGLSTR